MAPAGSFADDGMVVRTPGPSPTIPA